MKLTNVLLYIIPLADDAPFHWYRVHRFPLRNWKNNKEWLLIPEKECIPEKSIHMLQLYYNYYLRTSGMNFLLESYTFYDAIHGSPFASHPSPCLDIQEGLGLLACICYMQLSARKAM